MGNRSSSAAPSSSMGSTTTVDKRRDDDDGNGDGSGLYLSPELQARIDNDFESRILNAEWDKYRASHLERHLRRESQTSSRLNEMREKSKALTEKSMIVQKKLEDDMDDRRSRLADLCMEVEHDIDKLRDRYVPDGIETKMSMGACLDVRAELTRCYNALGDDGKGGGECRVFVQRLDRCVTDALRGTRCSS